MSGETASLSQARRSFWRAWTLSCAAGELLGMGAAAAVAGGILLLWGEPANLGEQILTLMVMVLAGTFEGLCIGFFQWRVLRCRFPHLPAKSWIGMTVFVAALGWFFGMLPSTFMSPGVAAAEPFDPPLGLTAFFALAAGLAAGTIFGAAQWLVLRRYAANAARWITGNALGWGLGLAWIYVAAALPDENTALGITLAIGAAAGILAGLSVGSITGIYLLQIEPQ